MSYLIIIQADKDFSLQGILIAGAVGLGFGSSIIAATTVSAAAITETSTIIAASCAGGIIGLVIGIAVYAICKKVAYSRKWHMPQL